MKSVEIIPLSLLAVILIIAVIYDIRFHKIPNWLTFPAMAIGLFYHVSVSGLWGCVFSLEGLFLGIALFIPFYIVAGMGAGDIKLMGAVGGFIGPKSVLMASFGTVIVGSVYALVLLTLHGYFKETVTRFWLMIKMFLVTRKFTYIPPKKGEKKPMLAYGVAIAIGTVSSVVFFDVMKIKII